MSQRGAEVGGNSCALCAERPLNLPPELHRERETSGSQAFAAVHVLCLGLDMSTAKRFVYILKNADATPHFYVGVTSDVAGRLADHNSGRCPHTARRRPWHLQVIIAFPDEQRAIRFERYLKSGSGRAFARLHFDL